MLQDCISRLEWLGYKVEEPNDELLLKYLLQKVEHQVQCDCNITTVPIELNEYVIDNVVGEFLFDKKSTGTLDIASINLDMIAKSVQEGDTKVEFAVENGNSPEQRFDNIIKHLMSRKQAMLVTFRRLKW